MSTTNNRVRSRQLSFRLTEKELSRWNKKQKASGLNKTEFLLKILDKSDVKIYQFNNTIKAILHELQMTGNNLNQIAYLANCGYFHEAADKIPAFQKQYYTAAFSKQIALLSEHSALFSRSISQHFVNTAAASSIRSSRHSSQPFTRWPAM